MIELTKHQVNALNTMGKGKKYITTVSRKGDDVNLKTFLDALFAEDMQLVEWKLVVNITELESEKKILAEMEKEDSGRRYFVLKGTKMTGIMFGYKSHDRIIN